ncbi:MAG: biotin--[acetyl-CoA-carboxylase] ligase [Clostridiales Family XIII bacterium]|jgi:BirA family biotin operon repressor/biotin-[acetyl-CoA-carboxylase] ligase|nr:biotin--[acetyl-CoA-carboxylase] ligase [Clostridiales Family XIII bacterium]
MNEQESARAELSLPHRRMRLLQNDVYVYRTLSSTNRVATFMAASGAPAGTIVLSAFQSAGVGRLRRAWIAPPGRSLLLSVILRPRIETRFISQLALLGGVALAEAIREETGLAAGVKWPNDVLMRGRKVSGILAQGSVRGDAIDSVILGVGLNVNQTEAELPPDCRDTATSLRAERGRRVSRAAMLRRFILRWNAHLEAFSEGGHPYLRAKWIENNLTLGREVSVHGADGDLIGTAVDISERGGLVVRFPGGIDREFLAEDLSLGGEHYRRLARAGEPPGPG